MALEKVGIGGVLTFDEKQAVRGMQSATRASSVLTRSFGQITNVARAVGSGMGQLAGAMRSFGVAALPATAAVGFGTKMAVDFERQMSAVEAITGATADQMARLEREAKKQGATTVFSATQAAGGMEFLSRAGFSVEEQISAIGPVLNAAAADGIGLAETSNIVANTLRAMGMEAAEAARVADVLALTSARSNTNILQLGEAMRYAAPQAKTMNVNVEQLAAVLGAAADAGLQGSIGGTSFTQAMVKLLKPTGDGEKLLRKYNVTIRKTAEGYTDIVDVFGQVSKGIMAMSDPIDRARAVTELFGIRGQKAVGAVLSAIESGRMEFLYEQLKNAAGSAERMAKVRLDNLAGAFTLLRSATEGFALETAGLFLGPMREGIQGFTQNLSNVVLVLQELNSEQGLTEETSKKAGSTIVQVAKGIKDGIDAVVDAWRSMRQQITDLVSQFTGEQSPEMIRSFTKIATIIFVVAGAVAPVLIAIGGLAFFISSAVIPAFAAIGTIATAVLGPILLPLLVTAIAAFVIFRREGDSVGDTFARIGSSAVAAFGYVKETFMNVVSAISSGVSYLMETAIKPFIAGFEFIPNVFGFVGEKFGELMMFMRQNFGDVIGAISQAAVALKPLFQGIFTFIGSVVGIIVQGMGLAFTSFFEIVKGLMFATRNIVLSVVESIVGFIKDIALGLGTIANVVGLEIGKTLEEFGKERFEVKVGVERGITTVEEEKPKVMGEESVEKRIAKEMAEVTVTPAEAAAQIGELALRERAAGQLTGENVDQIADAVGSAVAANQPKEINVESKVCVDRKTVAKATSKHRQEVNERAGFRATPWQRRVAVEQGAAPVGGA